MDALKKLQHLSVVSKVAVELDNNCGINDQTVGKVFVLASACMVDVFIFQERFRGLHKTAEFVVDIANACSAPEQFSKRLSENGAEFPVCYCGDLTLTTFAIKLPLSVGCLYWHYLFQRDSRSRNPAHLLLESVSPHQAHDGGFGG